MTTGPRPGDVGQGGEGTGPVGAATLLDPRGSAPAWRALGAGVLLGLVLAVVARTVAAYSSTWVYAWSGPGADQSTLYARSQVVYLTIHFVPHLVALAALLWPRSRLRAVGLGVSVGAAVAAYAQSMVQMVLYLAARGA